MKHCYDVQLEFRRLGNIIREKDQKLAEASELIEKLKAESKRQGEDLLLAKEARVNAEKETESWKKQSYKLKENLYTLETGHESCHARLGTQTPSDTESDDDSLDDRQDDDQDGLFEEETWRNDGSSGCSSAAEDFNTWKSDPHAWDEPTSSENTGSTTTATSTTDEGAKAPDPEPPLADEQWHHMLLSSQGRTFRNSSYVHDEWLHDKAGAVILPSRFTKTMLQRGLELAAETKWRWLQREKPELIPAWAPAESCELLLDRETMISRGFGYRDNFFGPEHPHAQRILMDKIGLMRNALAHFSHLREETQPAKLFGHIHAVLDFAADLGDPSGVEMAKELLEDIRKEAHETYDYIERNVLLAQLPGASPWAPHHVLLFERVQQEFKDHLISETFAERFDLDLGTRLPPRVYSRYGSAVVQAAYHYSHCSQTRTSWNEPLELKSADKELMLDEQLRYRYIPWAKIPDNPNDPLPWTTPRPVLKRRYSVCGSDCNAMARAGFANSRWKQRKEPRVRLGWVDLALKL